MSDEKNSWIDTKTKLGHPIYSMFSCDTERPNKNYVALEDYEKLEAELEKANRYLNNVITQCHVYIPLREAILKHLEKYRTK